MRARQRFGLRARQIHVDTTSFSVSGVYAPEAVTEIASKASEGELDAQVVAITYGYSRDRRADLKQWMLASAASSPED